MAALVAQKFSRFGLETTLVLRRDGGADGLVIGELGVVSGLETISGLAGQGLGVIGLGFWVGCCSPPVRVK